MNTLKLDGINRYCRKEYVFSAASLVNYYNDFCRIRIFYRKSKYFSAEFLPLSICIYNLYTFSETNMSQAPMVSVMES